MIKNVKCGICGSTDLRQFNNPKEEATDLDWFYGKVVCAKCKATGSYESEWKKADCPKSGNLVS